MDHDAAAFAPARDADSRAERITQIGFKRFHFRRFVGFGWLAAFVSRQLTDQLFGLAHVEPFADDGVERGELRLERWAVRAKRGHDLQ